MFDYRHLSNNRNKAIDYNLQSEFYQFVNTDLIDRLKPIDKSCRNILLIGMENQIITSGLDTRFPDHKLDIILDEQRIYSTDKKFDLIIFPLALHFVADVPMFLAKVRSILQNDGVFIGNFPGGGSLGNLRNALIKLEEENSQFHRPHILPFIKFEHTVPLMQQAGFTETIIDMEEIALEYATALDLMKAIKNSGHSNVLDGKITYSINKNMYKSLSKQGAENFIDYINLITFIASPNKNSIKLQSK